MALGRTHLGIALTALAVALSTFLSAPTAEAADPAPRGPFLITAQTGGIYRTEVRFPHRSERVLALGAWYGPQVAPTGRLLVAKYVDRTNEHLRVQVSGDGETHVLAKVDTSCVTELAISNDGARATYADTPDDDGCGSPATVHLVDIDTGDRLELPAPPRSNWFGAEPVFSRDGSYVSLMGHAQGMDVLWLYDATTGERLRALTGYRPTDLPTDDGAVVVHRTKDTRNGARARMYTVPISAGPLARWEPALKLTVNQAEGITASPDGSTLAWITAGDGMRITLAPVDDVTDRRDLGRSRTGPGRPVPLWVTNRFLATQSPEEDDRAIRRVSDGKPVPGPIPVIRGWTR